MSVSDVYTVRPVGIAGDVLRKMISINHTPPFVPNECAGADSFWADDFP